MDITQHATDTLIQRNICSFLKVFTTKKRRIAIAMKKRVYYFDVLNVFACFL